MAFSSGYTTVKGISERRRIPRLSKIRLGIKMQGKSKKTGEVIEYPAELPFFLLPDIVARKFGGNVTVERAKQLGCERPPILKFIEANLWRLAEELEIMLPINDMGAVFPHSYRWYGSSKGVKCIGDGETATRMNEDRTGMTQMPCPCEKLKTEKNPRGECTLRGNLMCLIPKVSMGGVFQIDLGSYHSVIDVNSGIEYVEELVGRFALVPLIIRREPKETHHADQKQTHWTIKLLLNDGIGIEEIQQLRDNTQKILAGPKLALPPAEDLNPQMDGEPAAIIEGEFEEPEEEGRGDEAERLVLFGSLHGLKGSNPDQYKVARAQLPADINEATIQQLRNALAIAQAVEK